MFPFPKLTDENLLSIGMAAQVVLFSNESFNNRTNNPQQPRCGHDDADRPAAPERPDYTEILTAERTLYAGPFPDFDPAELPLRLAALRADVLRPRVPLPMPSARAPPWAARPDPRFG